MSPQQKCQCGTEKAAWRWASEMVRVSGSRVANPRARAGFWARRRSLWAQQCVIMHSIGAADSTCLMRCLPLPRAPAPLLLHRLCVTLRNGKLRHKRPASHCAPCFVSDLPSDFELNLLGLKADPRFSPLQLHRLRPPTRIRRPHLSTNLQLRRRQLTRHRRTRPHTCRIPTNRPGAAP